ncbi:hypothetical protein RKE30_13575 [Streptomyces sp. Li-HN-5-11]|uniref:hypothetical protein n=1 Tax=Streptomyces sp. Li-HN-5-11 TaxID=3075432 RepID=UPI0028A5E8E0|nr:hypothetical protein [Streptomyces sp. Li-HN-5-11]WNM31364.1 hypothetical protein RKE30_13575 [Streptomyces sp. Li-HN-5-11]
MRRRRFAVVAFLLAALAAEQNAGVPTPASAVGTAAGHIPVIVVGGSVQPRAGAVRTAQTPLLHDLGRHHASNVRAFTLVNAVSATVPARELPSLRSDPAVRQVVVNRVIGGTAPAPSRVAGGQAAPTGGACPSRDHRPLLEPEGVSLTHTASDDPEEPTAQSLGITGKGVTVGFIADGVDTAAQDFVRADGSHVFSDYVDYSGEGPDARTGGGQAFTVASAIAAQGLHTYDVKGFGTAPAPGRCRIRILGAAPGAGLVGVKTFGLTARTTTADLVESIEYAVRVDHVDVLQESFAYHPFPDVATADLVQRFNDAAVASGTTVTVSAGDTTFADSVGAPADDPAVISVGTSTAFRWYGETGFGGYRRFPLHGWVDGSVSALSPSGTTQSGRTVDLVAPGDSGFAACTPDTGRYADCVNLAGAPSPVIRAGATAQAAALTAGAAALVIQAYREAHQGSSPAPAVVKQLLTSTADDLGASADEQGAGQLNSYAAVRAAQSIGRTTGASTVLTDTSQLAATAAPGTEAQWTLNLHNPGASPQTVRLSGRALGPAGHAWSGETTLTDAGSAHFTDPSGVRQNCGTLHFPVERGADRLDASITYPSDGGGTAHVALIDPRGRYAAYSGSPREPGYGHVTVDHPVPGAWTALVFSPERRHGGVEGRVGFRSTTARFTRFGSVSPAEVTLAPGQSAPVTVTARVPGDPGDTTAAVVLDRGAGGRSSVPVVLRGLVDVGHGGAFRGGGTRPGVYRFDVPEGRHDIGVDIRPAGGRHDGVLALLVDPQGQTAAYGTDSLATAYDPATGKAALRPADEISLYARAPVPGRWTLILKGPGDRGVPSFDGTVRFDQVQVSVSDLPQGDTLKPGVPVTATVHVRNRGAGPLSLFLDPRLDTKASVPLVPVQPATHLPLPGPRTAPSPAWLVPSESTGLLATAHATGEVQFDAAPVTGDPDLISTFGTDVQTGYVSSAVPAGLWGADPSVPGPSGPGGSARTYADLTMVVGTRSFDPAVTSAVGDLWRASVGAPAGLRPLVLEPGETGDIPVTVTPSGDAGTTVKGTLFVDTLVAADTRLWDDQNFSLRLPAVASADELAGLPYTYRIG